MFNNIYEEDNAALSSLGFKLQGEWINNRYTYFLEENNLQVYVYISYEAKDLNLKYRAQITKQYITEAIIKSASTLEELINNITQGKVLNY